MTEAAAIIAIGDLFVAFLVVLAIACIVIAVMAFRDCIARGDRKIHEAMDQMEDARRVTGRIQ